MNYYEKFTRQIAKLEPGCAPSAGYFQELIYKARQAITKEELPQFNPNAVEVLNYLNELAERNYKPNKRNLNYITARLNEGYTVEILKLIVVIKTVEWKNNPEFNKHLNYETLFRPTKIEKYVQEAETVKRDPEKYKKHVEQLNKDRERKSSMSGSKSDWFI